LLLLSASWLIPVEGPPIEGGALLVSGDRVVAVGRARQLAADWPGARREELDGCALLPALVNCHTHLELSALGRPPPRGPFDQWLLEVIRRKRTAQVTAFEEGVRAGLAECLAAGQGTVADVLSVPEAADAYPAEGPQVRVFSEVISSSPDRVAAAVDRALRIRPQGNARFAGLSPHAPYTACAEAYQSCAREVRRRGALLMTHLAETEEEVGFCARGARAFVGRLYADLPVSAPPSPGLPPAAWLEGIGVLDTAAILVHGVHFGAGDVDRLVRREARVVLCPRSNRQFGSARAPGRELLHAGLAVGLGTDSRLSAGDLDLWKDVICAVEDYGWSPAEAVAAATSGGGRVLDLKDRGALLPGRRADILAVRLGTAADLWERVLADPRPAALWLSGRPMFGSNAPV